MHKFSCYASGGSYNSFVAVTVVTYYVVALNFISEVEVTPATRVVES